MDAKRSTISRPILHEKWNRQQVPVLKRHNQQGSQMQISSLVCCKKRRATQKVLLGCDPLNDKWANLDANLLIEIFSQLPVIDLFFSVASVCQSWEAACLDFLFWSRNVLDMSATGACFGIINSSALTTLFSAQTNRVPGFFGVLESTAMYSIMATKLMRKLRRIMEGVGVSTSCLRDWRDSIQTVILPYDLEISDTHLLYIAERTPHLQRLLLLCPSRITEKGFNKAMKNWRHMKEMHLRSLNDDQFTQFIQGIGENCQDLESLHIHEKDQRIDQTRALLIANNLPGLKKLEFEFEFGYVLSSGLTTLYNLCLNLQEVYFTKCQMAHENWPLHGFDPFYPWPHSFRVKWMVGEDGFAKWQVKASLLDVELFNKQENKPCSVEEFQEFLDNQLPPDFFKWIICAVVTPRR